MVKSYGAGTNMLDSRCRSKQKLAEIARCGQSEDVAGSPAAELSRRGMCAGELGDEQRQVSVSEVVATSIAFVHYNFDMPSAELADTSAGKLPVLVAPGWIPGIGKPFAHHRGI